MNEERETCIRDAVQSLVMHTLMGILDQPDTPNFGSFTIVDSNGIKAIVTLQRPGMKTPIERYHEVRDVLRAIRDVAIDDRGDPRSDRIIAMCDAALANKPPVAG